MDKKLDMLRLPQNPNNSDIEVTLQSVSRNVSEIIKYFRLVSGMVKDIFDVIDVLEKGQKDKSCIDIMDEVNTKVDRIIMYLADCEEDIDFQSTLQPKNSQSTIHELGAVKF